MPELANYPIELVLEVPNYQTSYLTRIMRKIVFSFIIIIPMNWIVVLT